MDRNINTSGCVRSGTGWGKDTEVAGGVRDTGDPPCGGCGSEFRVPQLLQGLLHVNTDFHESDHSSDEGRLWVPNFESSLTSASFNVFVGFCIWGLDIFKLYQKRKPWMSALDISGNWAQSRVLWRRIIVGCSFLFPQWHPTLCQKLSPQAATCFRKWP